MGRHARSCAIALRCRQDHLAAYKTGHVLLLVQVAHGGLCASGAGRSSAQRFPILRFCWSGLKTGSPFASRPRHASARLACDSVSSIRWRGRAMAGAEGYDGWRRRVCAITVDSQRRCNAVPNISVSSCRTDVAFTCKHKPWVSRKSKRTGPSDVGAALPARVCTFYFRPQAFSDLRGSTASLQSASAALPDS